MLANKVGLQGGSRCHIEIVTPLRRSFSLALQCDVDGIWLYGVPCNEWRRGRDQTYQHNMELVYGVEAFSTDAFSRCARALRFLQENRVQRSGIPVWRQIQPLIRSS